MLCRNIRITWTHAIELATTLTTSFPNVYSSVLQEFSHCEIHFKKSTFADGVYSIKWIMTNNKNGNITLCREGDSGDPIVQTSVDQTNPQRPSYILKSSNILILKVLLDECEGSQDPVAGQWALHLPAPGQPRLAPTLQPRYCCSSRDAPRSSALSCTARCRRSGSGCGLQPPHGSSFGWRERGKPWVILLFPLLEKSWEAILHLIFRTGTHLIRPRQWKDGRPRKIRK